MFSFFKKFCARKVQENSGELPDENCYRIDMRHHINTLNLQDQKALAKEIFHARKVPVGEKGVLVGLINARYYVLETLEGELLSICGRCAQYLVNKTKKHGLDYNFFMMRFSLRLVIPKNTDLGYAFEEVPYTGPEPICEMSCCTSCRDKKAE